MPNPAHPRETTTYAKARALCEKWSRTDMHQATAAALRADEAALLALRSAAPPELRIPGNALLAQFGRELQRRAMQAAVRRTAVAGSYTQALHAVTVR